jgi:hypothetical protein
MAKVVERDTTFIRDFIMRRDPSRKEGVHLSGIILAIMKELYPKTYDRPDDPDDHTVAWRFLSGNAWEYYLERALADYYLDHYNEDEMIIRPDQICVDGIWGSPDGYNISEQSIYEYKFTWKSGPNDEKGTSIEDEKFTYYMIQMKSYCHMWGTNKSTLWPLFCNGSYNQGYQPALRAWDFTWTAAELKRNWKMILKWKDKAIKEVAA